MREYAEYGKIESGNKVISARIEKTLSQLSKKPSESILRSCGDVNQSKAIYRLLSNAKFKSEQVTCTHAKESVTRIKESGAETILILQDSSEVHYPNFKETEGLGVIGKKKTNLGLLLHNALAVGINDEIYGLFGQEVIIRETESYGSRHDRKKKSIEEKESNKWLKMMENTQKAVPSGVTGVHVSDREGDIYEYFEKCESIGSKYLCRRTYNRKITGEHSEINEYIDGLPVLGELAVQIPRDSHTKRKAREAKLTVKSGECEILRPANLKNLPDKLTVYVVSAVEADAPSNVKEPISWQLITNIPVKSFDEVVEKISWYMKRWRIEDFHYTLKSGCSIEQRRASTKEKLEKLIALYSVISVDILRMTWIARTSPDISCEILFTEDQWKILYCVANRTPTAPTFPPTIYEAVRFIAIIGGFSNRKSDGEPGVKSIWIGLSIFNTIIFANQFL